MKERRDSYLGLIIILIVGLSFIIPFTWAIMKIVIGAFLIIYALSGLAIRLTRKSKKGEKYE